MPPRKIRETPEARALRAITRMSAGTIAGRVESASPARRLPDARITQGRGAGCPCPVSVRLCSHPYAITEQELTWHQDSGFTEGKDFADDLDLRFMHPPDSGRWNWFLGTHDYGKGDLAHVFVLDHVITDGELATLTDAAGIAALSGLLAYWPMDEPSGTTAVDDAGSNDGTYNGGVTLGVSGSPFGGTAARYDGTDDYMSAPLAWGALKTLTFGMWVNWDTFANDNRTLADRDTLEDKAAFKITPSGHGEGLWSTVDNTFFVGIGGADTGSGGYAAATCPRPTTGWGLWIVSLDVDDLGQNSAGVGPRPKIRIWFGDTVDESDCALLAADDVLLVDGGGTVTMPPAADATRHIYYVKNVGGGTFTLDPDGSELIDDAASLDVAPLDSATIVSDGTQWWVL